MKLFVYSLKRVLFEGEVSSVNCKTIDGEITVLDHHRPLITVLGKGTVRVTDAADKEHYIPVTSGFLEIAPDNRGKLLVDEAAG